MDYNIAPAIFVSQKLLPSPASALPTLTLKSHRRISAARWLETTLHTTNINAILLAQLWHKCSGTLRASIFGTAPPLATATMAALALAQSSQGPGQLQIHAWFQNAATENEAARSARPTPEGHDASAIRARRLDTTRHQKASRRQGSGQLALAD